MGLPRAVRETFDFIEKIEHVQNLDYIAAEFSTCLHRYGFHSFLVTRMPLPNESFSAKVMLNGWAEGWFEEYVSRDLHWSDPIAARTRESVDGFSWSSVEVAPKTRAHEVMKMAAGYRMREGYSLPIHGEGHLQACVTMAGEKVNLSRDTEGAIALMSMFAHGRLKSLASIRRETSLRDVMSKREREVLTWVAYGKSSWEINNILSISVSTVDKHVGAAMLKVDASNRTAAVAKALMAGAISI